MFGLRNHRGSCWINACLQAVYRIPDVQQRYSSGTFDKTNIIDSCLFNIYKTKGEDGLKDLFDSIRTVTMPAGNGIGDSHELLIHLCDKLPFLDQLCRFKVASVIECKTCKEKQVKEDSVVEFTIDSPGRFVPISTCISNSVAPQSIDDWVCEKCKNKGCTKQQLIGTFPKIMTFYMTNLEGSINYSSILVLNGKKYALNSIVCFTGGHWMTHGRDMPPGSSWYTFDDQMVADHGPKQFPVSNKMRFLIYYRLED